MALPKLNATPAYEMTVPSTKQKVTFRPFLVKEQKILLMALETQDRNEIVRAVTRTVRACVEQDLGKLTSFDVDYMFTIIRSKSVGETAEVLLKCSHCDHNNEVTIQLDHAFVDGDVNNATIELTSDIHLSMQYPSYEQLLQSEALTKGASITESLMELIIVCLDSVHTQDERISFKDESREEIIKFIESMSAQQFDKLSEFVSKAPALAYNTTFVCSSCGGSNDASLRGMDDFF